MTAVIIQMPGAGRLGQRNGADDDPAVLAQDLKRARVRIAQLEASLTQAMRDNLANFNRAREAERKLKTLEACSGT